MNAMKLLITLLFALLLNVSNAQDSLSNYTNQREIAYDNGQSISDSDRNFCSKNGEVLPALVSEKRDISITYTFETFRNINERNQSHILDRIKSITPKLIAISNQDKKIIASFSLNVTEGELNEFFRLFGYDGYKVMIKQSNDN